jgi:predicted LPLAT superfamily acyltransferase
VLGIRFVLWLATVLGRGPARLFVRILAFYYTLFSGAARRATRDYLARVGEEPSFSRVYKQILRFSQVTLDSLFFVSGKLSHYEITETGREHIMGLLDAKQGAILLGGHLGSMYAMRAKGGTERLPLYAIVYTKHAERINTVLREISPESHAQLLQMGEGVDFMLRIRELIEGGAIVALFGDRVGSDDRAVEAEFFGKTARFPAGPYILASMLKCPVYLTFGLYRDPRTYDLFCEPFAELIELPRKSREEALRRYAQMYASRLEHYVKLAPDNWFNFFDFWGNA